MADSNAYTALIAGSHKGKPLFQQAVYEVTEPFVDFQSATVKLRQDFDLDTAVGEQLDAIGVRVGLPRKVSLTISGLYFGLDEGEGDWEYLDKGLWKGEFDAETEMLDMGDTLYRAALRSKVVCNHYDGTTSGSFNAARIILGYFGTAPTSITDGQDMTFTIGVNRASCSEFVWALIGNRLLDFTPAGVTLTLHNTGA